MAEIVFVRTQSDDGAAPSTTRHVSIDDAARRARFLLGNGAASVQILDATGQVLTSPVADPPNAIQEI